MGDRKIKVAAIQMKAMPRTSGEEKIDHLCTLIEKASEQGCQMILPPEIINTDYGDFYKKDVNDPALFDLFKVAESIPGPSTDKVGELTKKYGNYVILPMFEKAAPGIYYNSAATIGPDGTVVGNYRKVQVAGVQVLEKMYFRAGNEFKVHTTEFYPNARFGTIICHDRRYPETSRVLAMQDCEIMFCPVAGPGYAAGVYWDIVNRARSVDTGMFTIYANRVGKEVEKEYFGESMIVSPFGEVLAHAGKEEDAILTAELDLDLVDEARIRVPTLRDVRCDLYGKYYSNGAKWDELISK